VSLPLLSAHHSASVSFNRNCAPNGNKLAPGQTGLNPKHEILVKHPAGINSKQFRMSKIRNAKAFLLALFEHLDFGFVSDFEFTEAPNCLAPAMPG